MYVKITDDRVMVDMSDVTKFLATLGGRGMPVEDALGELAITVFQAIGELPEYQDQSTK